MDDAVGFAVLRDGQDVKLDVALKQKKVRMTKCKMMMPCILRKEVTSVVSAFTLRHLNTSSTTLLLVSLRLLESLWVIRIAYR